MSSAQPHMCKPGSVVFLPAGALSLAESCAGKHSQAQPAQPSPAGTHTCGARRPCLTRPRPGAQRPSPRSGRENRQGTEGLFKQPRSSDQTQGTFLHRTPPPLLGLCRQVSPCAGQGRAGQVETSEGQRRSRTGIRSGQAHQGPRLRSRSDSLGCELPTCKKPLSWESATSSRCLGLSL